LDHNGNSKNAYQVGGGMPLAPSFNDPADFCPRVAETKVGLTKVFGLGERFNMSKSIHAITLAAFSMFVLAGTAQATSFTFNSSGTPACSEACSGTAVITPGAGTLTVVLTDNQANPRSAGDLLSSIEITLTGSQGTPTLSSQAGSLINVTPGASSGTPVAGSPTHWGVGVSSSNCTGGASCIALETAGPFAVGGAPINMIIGPAPYTNSNASIGNFNPYINGTGNFVIADTAVTAATTIAGVTFDFGTSPDTFQPGTLVPEPNSLVLLGSGLITAAAFQQWRKRKASKSA
jgi:hypothetical protein